MKDKGRVYKRQRQTQALMELAVNDSENQKNQNCNDSNSDHPIRSHPKQHTNSQQPRPDQVQNETKGSQYLRAMPLKVLILVST